MARGDDYSAHGPSRKSIQRMQLEVTRELVDQIKALRQDICELAVGRRPRPNLTE